jgi:hypothetical protein
MSEMVYSDGVQIFLKCIPRFLAVYVTHTGKERNAHHILAGKS